jgi:hypothetical protein
VALPFLSAFNTPKAAKTNAVNLPDALKSLKAFSFRKHKVVKLKGHDGFIHPDVDLVWDPPSGLASNNGKNGGIFKGKGGVIDLGRQKIKEVKKAPTSGYVPALTRAQIFVGHTYCVLTADGKHYAKIHVTQYDWRKKKLTITWCFQEKSSNRFGQ